MARGYMDLEVWKLAIETADGIYETVNSFPSDEKYGLISQMKRAAISIPSNIAEGSSRGGTKEFVNFVYIAKGSISELETQLVLAKYRKFLAEKEFTLLMEKLDRMDKMLFGLIKSLKNKIA